MANELVVGCHQVTIMLDQKQNNLTLVNAEHREMIATSEYDWLAVGTWEAREPVGRFSISMS